MIRSEDVPTKNSESEAIFHQTANQSFLRKPYSEPADKKEVISV
jgi:hypothetical protein